MDNIISVIEKNKLQITLSKDYYEKTAILAAAYKLTDRCTVFVQPSGESNFCIIFSPKEGIATDSLKEVAEEFVNAVLDQQLRLSLEKQYGKIRELIVEHAFAPITDLRKRLADK